MRLPSRLFDRTRKARQAGLSRVVGPQRTFCVRSPRPMAPPLRLESGRACGLLLGRSGEGGSISRRWQAKSRSRLGQSITDEGLAALGAGRLSAFHRADPVRTSTRAKKDAVENPGNTTCCDAFSHQWTRSIRRTIGVGRRLVTKPNAGENDGWYYHVAYGCAVGRDRPPLPHILKGRAASPIHSAYSVVRGRACHAMTSSPRTSRRSPARLKAASRAAIPACSQSS